MYNQTQKGKTKSRWTPHQCQVKVSPKSQIISHIALSFVFEQGNQRFEELCTDGFPGGESSVLIISDTRATK